MRVSPESARLLDAALGQLVEDYRYGPHPRRTLAWGGKKLVKRVVVSEGWTTRKNGMVMGSDGRMVARGFVGLLLRWREEGGRVSDNFYIVSFEHTQSDHDFITLWRPNNSGYCWPVEWAGTYTREQIEAQRGYYSNGESTMAVPVDVVQRLFMHSDGFFREDEPNATVLLNAAPVWKALFKAALPTTGPMREVKIKGGSRWVKP